MTASVIWITDTAQRYGAVIQMTRPYIGIAPDDHRIYARWPWDIEDYIQTYIEGHPWMKRSEFRVFPISLRYYREFVRNRYNPLWWFLQQGSPLKPLSNGRKEQIARMIRNIPHAPIA